MTDNRFSAPPGLVEHRCQDHSGDMGRTWRAVLAGWVGLAVGEIATWALGIGESPLDAVGQWIIEFTPAAVVEPTIAVLGQADKPVLFGLVLVVTTALFAALGRLGRKRPAVTSAGFVALSVIAAVALVTRPALGPSALIVPAIGLTATLIVWWWATRPSIEAQPERRTLLRLGVLAGIAVLGAAAARMIGRTSLAAQSARSRLRLPVTTPGPPAGSSLQGLPPWQTPTRDFYRIDTRLVPPFVDPDTWRLRVHGLVAHELTLTFDDLLRRKFTEAWITLNCVSNPVGGDLIGNAWWSGVRIADILAEAGIQEGADAILQTSQDGWTCATPLQAVTDDRNALLAVAMNGEPLPAQHGFPVRMIVPGLYGFVSATKWLVDIEVTRFADVSAYWTDRGWAEQAPVRLASRIDRPAADERVASGRVTFGGSAWQQHTGIAGVEIAVDGGPWRPARLAPTPTVDTWVQWSADAEVTPGDHVVRVRATSRSGEVQTGDVRSVVPDGATGWHEVRFSAG